MTKHQFIFAPGEWLGEGRIAFTASPDILRFYTKWNIKELTNHIISCQQRVEMEGRDEDIYNNFVFSAMQPESFIVEISNDTLGLMMGKGILDTKTIAWEFRGNPEFEGFEVYELQDNGDYMLHAEYMSTDQYRTIIDGRVWRKGA